MNKLFVIVTGIILGGIIVVHNPPTALLTDSGAKQERSQDKNSSERLQVNRNDAPARPAPRKPASDLIG